MARVTKVPFSDNRSELARLLQMPGERLLLVGQVMQRVYLDEFPILRSPEQSLRSRRHL